MKNFPAILPRRNSKAAFRIVDGEAVIVSPSEGIVSILNRTASRIWELSDGTNGMDEIVNIVSNEFDISGEDASMDIKEFMEDLSEKGMIEL